MDTSKAAVVVNAALGKIAIAVGYPLGALSLFSILACLVDLDIASAVFALIILFCLLAFSIFLCIKGPKIARRIKRFKRYVSLISAQHMTSLDALAASTSQTVDFVRNDLQKMIDKKFFVNASIDRDANEIIIGRGTPRVPVSEQVPPEALTAWDMFTCSGCGAFGTKPRGRPGNCEYCGSMIP